VPALIEERPVQEERTLQRHHRIIGLVTTLALMVAAIVDAVVWLGPGKKFGW
jgi:hypothetical protein